MSMSVIQTHVLVALNAQIGSVASTASVPVDVGVCAVKIVSSSENSRNQL